MPAGAFIQDSEMRMNILTAQPLGVASQDPSSLQVFLDRKLDQDDNRGMEQAMDDNILTSSKFVVFFETKNKKFGEGSEHLSALNHPTLLAQTLSFDLISPIVKLVLMASKSEESPKLKSHLSLSSKKALPCDLRLGLIHFYNK